MSLYYVYVWHICQWPVYVGKGKGSRAGNHLADKDWAQGRELSCDVYPFPSEAEALFAEALVIRLMGTKYQTRRHNGGVLENKQIPPSPDLGTYFSLHYPKCYSDRFEAEMQFGKSVTRILTGYHYPHRELLEALDKFSRSTPSCSGNVIDPIVRMNLSFLLEWELITEEAASESNWFGVC